MGLSRRSQELKMKVFVVLLFLLASLARAQEYYQECPEGCIAKGYESVPFVNPPTRNCRFICDDDDDATDDAPLDCAYGLLIANLIFSIIACVLLVCIAFFAIRYFCGPRQVYLPVKEVADK